MRAWLPVIMCGVLLVGFVISSCSRSQKMTEEQLFGLAKNLQEKEQYEEAAKTLEKLVKDYPTGRHAEEALYRLGLLYANNLHDYKRAIASYQRLIEQFPNSTRLAQAYFMIGYHYANDVKDLDKARQAYNTFLEKFPNHELVPSVQFELKYLGKDISQLDIFQEGEATSSAGDQGSSKGGK
ncbi:MAG: outer membrane protein assembly factor BamD [candidate division KSB1 bacterium]|nr:outer membrane protein assembly factor BamD [candidate division KSB1 bacterium]